MSKLSVDRRLRSATIPPLVLNQPRKSLDTPERFLIGVLAMFGEVAFPSRETLADFMGCSVATIARTVKRLSEKGWLSVDVRRGENGRQATNRYHLRVPDGADAASSRTADQIDTRPPKQSDSPPVSSCATIKDSEGSNEEKDSRVAARGAAPAPAAAPKSSDPAPAAAAPRPVDPDVAFLKHTHAEFEKATGLTIVLTWGRDRIIARNILKKCGDDLVAARAVATRYARDGAERGWPVTLPGLLSRVEDVRQRISRERPSRPRDENVIAEHPMSRTARIEREWRAAHPGESPRSREQVSAWAKSAGRMILRRDGAAAAVRPTPPPASRSAPLPAPTGGR